MVQVTLRELEEQNAREAAAREAQSAELRATLNRLHRLEQQLRAANERVREAEQDLQAAEAASRQRESDRQALLAKVSTLEKDAAALPQQRQKVQELEDQVRALILGTSCAQAIYLQSFMLKPLCMTCSCIRPHRICWICHYTQGNSQSGTLSYSANAHCTAT